MKVENKESGRVIVSDDKHFYSFDSPDHIIAVSKAIAAHMRSERPCAGCAHNGYSCDDIACVNDVQCDEYNSLFEPIIRFGVGDLVTRDGEDRFVVTWTANGRRFIDTVCIVGRGNISSGSGPSDRFTLVKKVGEWEPGKPATWRRGNSSACG